MTKWKAALILVLLALGYLLADVSYLTTRAEYPHLMIMYFGSFALFAACIFLIRKSRSLAIPLIGAILLRILLLFSTPNLSDDFYRFLWDGNLSSQGINPFEYTPTEYLDEIGEPGGDLYQKMNSQDYYTIYPPVNQAIFLAAAMLFPGQYWLQVLVLKMFILLFEVGSLFLLFRLLQHFCLDRSLLFLYALNPLVILELTGNIHFEAAMICFTLLAIFFSIREKWWLSSLSVALAFSTKLWPLIFIPFFFNRMPFRKFLGFLGVFLLATILLWMPFYDDYFFEHFGLSLALYFRSFAFNGSLYYLIKNFLPHAGWVLSGVCLLAMIFIFLRDRGKEWSSIFAPLVLVLFTYLLCTTTVHPWYITPLIAFAILTNLRFPVIWSALIPLTYITYQTIPYDENLKIVLLEYTLLLAYFGYEWMHGRMRPAKIP